MAKRNLPIGGAIPMDPGERDTAVTVQQLSESVGASRMPVETWTTLAAPVWMKRMDPKANERFKAGQLSGSAETVWEMAYRSDMDPETVDVVKRRRLVAGGRVYDITGASVIGRREGLELVTLSSSKVA